MSKEKTRAVEQKMAELFSVRRRFSEHLFKWDDPVLPDKYDQNCFEYTDQPTKEEFLKALEHQKNRPGSFIKLEGDQPLIDDFGLKTEVSLTMELEGDTSDWSLNDKVRFATPSIEEMVKIESKHFGAICGEDFAERNVRRMYEKIRYNGAYIDDVMVGACYSFASDGMVCIDGLIVDEDFRRQNIATTLLAHVVESNGGSIPFLHAEEDDTPKEMYLKLGFEITDRLYEYSCLDIGSFEVR